MLEQSILQDLDVMTFENTLIGVLKMYPAVRNRSTYFVPVWYFVLCIVSIGPNIIFSIPKRMFFYVFQFYQKAVNKRLKTLTFINRKEKLDQRSSQVVKLGVIQQLRGPNFTQFWPFPPSSGQLWTFHMIPTLCHMTKRGLSTDPLPPPSFCSRSYWMSP